MSKPSGQASMPLLTPNSELFSGDMDAFMMAETEMAKNANLNVTFRRDKEKHQFTSGKVGRFLNEPINMSICGLEGCTAMAVISEKGAWLVHIWEFPSIRVPVYFMRDVVKIIETGDPTIDPKTGFEWVPNLNNLTGAGQMFDAKFRPRIFTLSPGDPNDLFPEGRVYRAQVSEIHHQLEKLFPNAPSTRTGYTIFKLKDEPPQTAKGNLLLQYTPAQSFSPENLQQAMVRIYVAEKPQPVVEFTWQAYDEQKI